MAPAAVTAVLAPQSRTCFPAEKSKQNSAMLQIQLEIVVG